MTVTQLRTPLLVRFEERGSVYMDFQSALETFAEAWVAANAQSALVSDNKNHKQRPDRAQTMAGEVPDSSASTSSRVLPSTTSAAGVKLLPIRCLVEKVVSGRKQDTAASTPTENYAVVPGGSLFRDIVQTALIKLGYSIQESASAKGAVHIKNWKAMPIDGITDNVSATVEDILGDLTSQATLKITMTIGGPSDDLREKLLHLLVKQSRDLLQAIGCPIAQEVVEKIVTGSCDASPEVRASFYKWYNESAFGEALPWSSQTNNSPPALPIPLARTPSKSRLRIYFDPDLELPKLNLWFSINRHPSRQEMVEYLQELNSQPRRLSSKPLDLTNIMYWFKNARAAQRRIRRNAPDAYAEEACPDYDEEESDDDDDPHHSETAGDAPQAFVNSSQQFIENVPDRSKECPPSAAPLQVMFTSSSGETEPPMPSGPAVLQAPSTYYTSSTDDDSEDDDDCDVISSAAPDENMQAEDLTMPKSNSRNHMTGEQSTSDALPPDGASSAPYAMDIKKESDSDMSKSSRSSSGASSPPSSMLSAPTMQGAGASTPIECRFPYGGFAASYMNSAASMLHPFFKSEQAHDYTKQRNGERQKRHRAFIDPVSEIPKLEQWFGTDTHPSHSVIEQICEDLNRGEFRSRYPKLTPKNIQLWFKNHRAKVKRMRLSQSHPDLCILTSSISQPTY